MGFRFFLFLVGVIHRVIGKEPLELELELELELVWFELRKLREGERRRGGGAH